MSGRGSSTYGEGCPRCRKRPYRHTAVHSVERPDQKPMLGIRLSVPRGRKDDRFEGLVRRGRAIVRVEYAVPRRRGCGGGLSRATSRCHEHTPWVWMFDGGGSLPFNLWVPTTHNVVGTLQGGRRDTLAEEPPIPKLYNIFNCSHFTLYKCIHHFVCFSVYTHKTWEE